MRGLTTNQRAFESPCFWLLGLLNYDKFTLFSWVDLRWVLLSELELWHCHVTITLLRIFLTINFLNEWQNLRELVFDTRRKSSLHEHLCHILIGNLKEDFQKLDFFFKLGNVLIWVSWFLFRTSLILGMVWLGLVIAFFLYALLVKVIVASSVKHVGGHCFRHFMLFTSATIKAVKVHSSYRLRQLPALWVDRRCCEVMKSSSSVL